MLYWWQGDGDPEGGEQAAGEDRGRTTQPGTPSSSCRGPPVLILSSHVRGWLTYEQLSYYIRLKRRPLWRHTGRSCPQAHDHLRRDLSCFLSPSRRPPLDGALIVRVVRRDNPRHSWTRFGTFYVFGSTVTRRKRPTSTGSNALSSSTKNAIRGTWAKPKSSTSYLPCGGPTRQRSDTKPGVTCSSLPVP